MFGWGKKPAKKEWKVNEKDPLVTKVIDEPPKDRHDSYEDIAHDNHQEVYDKVVKHFQNTKLYPIAEGDCPKEKYLPLNDHEKLWLSKQCFLRYLRACNWNESDTIKRITNSIAWRREFGIAGGEFDKVTADLVAVENETGKHQIFGFDNSNRPCLMLYTGRQNTKASDRQIQLLIYMIERCIEFMPQGQDKLCLCVDFKKYPEASIYDPIVPPVSIGKSILYILQYHYPERLGGALFINIPSLVNIFLKICWPFVDPYTKQKCKFDEPFKNFIDLNQLPVNYGGEVNYEYVHDDYWEDFIAKSEIKRKQMLENYNKLGSQIGLCEWELRNGI